jgi:hypothetical protein
MNTRIRPNPVLDPNNAAWVGHARDTRWYINTLSYANAIVYATGTENRFHVPTVHDDDWGDPFGPNRIPLRPEWKPSPGSDGWLVVVDAARSRAYWLWRYSWNGGKPHAAWGGTGVVGSLAREPWPDLGGGNGSGLSAVAGVITEQDLRRGYIDHALAFADHWTSSSHKYPASKSDGHGNGSRPIPMGQRVQLDPSINVGAQPWSRIEKMVAQALQTYGAYLVDSSGGSFGLAAQMDQKSLGGNPGPMWNAVGVTGDYWRLGHIPMTSLRFLKRWDGS